MSIVQYLEVPVGDLRPNPFNPNQVSAENERKIRESIRRNGIFKPIIVRQVAGEGGYEIIGGQHRWEQARELGLSVVPVANLGEIDDRRAKEIGLLDNARYGADDTVMLSDILRELGDASELQTFLPYGDSDLNAIFSASHIDLDDLEAPQETELSDEDEEIDLGETAKPARTHTIMRFKVSLADAEALTKLIAETRKKHGFTQEDDLTNAGDALVFLLKPTAAAPARGMDEMLDEIERLQKEDQ